MVNILDPTSRMKLLSMSELEHPGACRVCGNGACEQGYVSIDVYFEYEGWTYLCIPCLTEAAEAGGMLSVQESQRLLELNEKLLAQHNELLKMLEVANERLKHFDALLADYNASASLAVSIPDAQDDAGEDVSGESVKSDSVNPADAGEGHESESSEPVTSGERSGPVRSSGSDIDL